MEFGNDYRELRYRLIRAAYWIRHKIKKFLEPYGLTQQQFNVLRILREYYPQPLTTKDISYHMSDPYADTSRVVDRLLKKDLVKKKSNSRDRRLVQVWITQVGMDLLATIDQRQDELDAITAQLSPEKISQLNELLRELTEDHFKVTKK
ncbi:MAG: MarR family transcriptional regulator [Bacteroidota bacterium]